MERGGEVSTLVETAGNAGSYESTRNAGEHFGSVESEGLWAEKGGARRIEHVHAHVIGIGPDAQMGIVEEVRTEMIVIAVIRASGIACRRHCNALVGWYAHARKLANDPAVGELVI